MNIDGDVNTNEYIVTAVQIFDYCGVDISNTIHVDTLMDKFAPFVKTNKTEYSYLRSLLDPEHINPEITVSKLASTLNQYSENQKTKIDLDESFNLKGGQAPQDSDSGISNDGFQILEELQCELREKAHLAQQLRIQLELTDRHHEEALGALTAERDTLRAQLNVMREENASLSRARQDYEEACERLGSSERALSEARHDLAAARRKALRLADQVAVLEAEKLTLQELLTKSKDECHRINEMYASRQSLLLEENETLKTDHADLSTRLQDQEEFMQQMIKEKVLLEMELKDVLNKSNHIHSRMDRSIDVSYTEDQMLTALDSINADSKFIQESKEGEDFFVIDDPGRPSNMSLFDEIRLSFYNRSKLNFSDLNCTEYFEKRCEILDLSFGSVATQTDDKVQIAEMDNTVNICKIQTDRNIQTEEICCHKNEIGHKQEHKKLTCFTQTDLDIPYSRTETRDTSTNTSTQVFEVFKDVDVMNSGVQTDIVCNPYAQNNSIQSCTECKKIKEYTQKLEKDYQNACLDYQIKLSLYEKNLSVLSIQVEEGNTRNNFLRSVIDHLKSTRVEKNKQINDSNSNNSGVFPFKSDQSSIGTQVQLPCEECVKHTSPRWGIGKFFWDSVKCLFQLFAVVCFICAVCVLYGVRRAPAACRELPARWLRPSDLFDLLLRVEYVAEVPM